MKISTNSQRPKPKDQKPIAFIIHKILSKTFRNYRCLSKKHKTLSKSLRKHRRLSKKHKPLTRTFRKHPRFSIKTKFLRYFQNTQNLNGNFSPNHKSAPDCTFTKRRQLSEVSTPNRDVWRGAALSGTNQRRCVKTERRRRAVEDRFGWCCEGV